MKFVGEITRNDDGFYRDGKAPFGVVTDSGLVKIELVNLGEGLEGDYIGDDPDDINLLRFDLSVRKSPQGKWDDQVPDTSFCTRIPAMASDAQLRGRLVRMVLDFENKGYGAVLNGLKRE